MKIRSMLPRHAATVLLLCSLSFTGAGCGEEHDNNHDHNNDHNHTTGTNNANPYAEACEHMKDGPAKALTATAMSADAPDGSAEHTRLDVTLAAGDMMQYSGMVKYSAGEAGDFTIYTNSDFALKVLDDAQAEVAIEKSEDVSACAEVARAHTVEFEAGKTYYLSIGPVASETVQVVIEHAGEGHAH